jgi:diguanylate cyclase (GGDEF)-like protein
MDDSLIRDVVVGAAAAGVAIALFLLGSRFGPSRRASRGHKPGDLAADEVLVDPSTGLATRRAWIDVLHREEDRLARYGRNVTVLVAELDGLEAFAAALGEGVADWLVPPVAAAMRRNARASDILARIAFARFVALLPETDEVAATNYVERVRAESDTWLAACEVSVRLAIGWAQPVAGEHLTDALRLAENRMNADRRRHDFRAAPAAVSPLRNASAAAASMPPDERPRTPIALH